MLKKKFRIRKEKDFQKIFHLNKKIHSQNFQLLLHFIDQKNFLNKLDHPKFGFIVTKKVGNAVIRNKIKRRLREIVRLELPNLKNNFEAIMIAYPQIVENEYEDLKKEIVSLFKKNKLYTDL